MTIVPTDIASTAVRAVNTVPPAGMPIPKAFNMALSPPATATPGPRLFAGISLEGASLKVSDKATAAYYGSNASPKGILFASHEPPHMGPEAHAFIAALPQY